MNYQERLHSEYLIHEKVGIINFGCSKLPSINANPYNLANNRKTHLKLKNEIPPCARTDIHNFGCQILSPLNKDQTYKNSNPYLFNINTKNKNLNCWKDKSSIELMKVDE